MSYILDALKKSEQERGHGNIPDVQTVHSSSLNYRSEKKAYWPYILIAAVLLNLLAIVYFMINKPAAEKIETSTPPTSVVTQTKTETESEAVAEKAEPVVKAVTIISDENKNANVEKAGAETADKKTQAAEKTESITIKTEEPALNQDIRILEFYELPESIKQDLPSIVISAHVYSSNPLQRSIVINNKFLEEGEYVLDGLILYEITPDGAIFNYQGTVFSYGVVSGWQ